MNWVVFYRCEICGNVVAKVHNGGGQLSCCGQPMVTLEANSVDAALEKHVPVAQAKEGSIDIRVGSVDHPMLEEHHIEWVCAISDDGSVFVKNLDVDGEPHAVIPIGDKNIIAVYEYCNLHGLWKLEL